MANDGERPDDAPTHGSEVGRNRTDYLKLQKTLTIHLSSHRWRVVGELFGSGAECPAHRKSGVRKMTQARDMVE